MASDDSHQETLSGGVTLDKTVVKEALSELLNEVPAFKAFLAKSANAPAPPGEASGSGSGSSNDPQHVTSEATPPTPQPAGTNKLVHIHLLSVGYS